MMSLSDEILREHYSHVADEPFFPNIANFMQSAPVIAMVLEGDDVVAKVRTMLGPTNPQNAEAGTIRGDFGESMMINVCHASDSPENGEIEVNRFFSESETFSY
jgi:nucleoside-diphosphate kinase